MKTTRLLLIYSCLTICFSAFSQTGNAKKANPSSEAYRTAGDDFSAENILSADQLQQKYNQIRVGDTIAVTFTSRVISVCKKKGCWMKVHLDDNQEVMVKFRDYSFFVPKNIDGKQVVVNGRAYLSEISVEEQRHYAEDEGRSAAEIAAINKPALNFSFLADGVKIKK